MTYYEQALLMKVGLAAIIAAVAIAIVLYRRRRRVMEKATLALKRTDDAMIGGLAGIVRAKRRLADRIRERTDRQG